MRAGTEPLPSYDGRQRRAMSLKGGTDNIPVPAWMTASFDNYGRGSGCEWQESKLLHTELSLMQQTICRSLLIRIVMMQTPG